MKLFEPATKNNRELGDQLEVFASNKLAEAGLRIVAQNYLCKMGEIDIIARDGENLVFVEVRYRKSEIYGGSIASVDHKKQRRVSLAAGHYLQKHKLTNKIPCRFDVFAVTGNLANPKYQWIKAAFT